MQIYSAKKLFSVHQFSSGNESASFVAHAWKPRFAYLSKTEELVVKWSEDWNQSVFVIFSQELILSEKKENENILLAFISTGSITKINLEKIPKKKKQILKNLSKFVQITFFFPVIFYNLNSFLWKLLISIHFLRNHSKIVYPPPFVSNFLYIIASMYPLYLQFMGSDSHYNDVWILL